MLTILEDTEPQPRKKKRGHRPPSRGRKQRYIKRYLRPIKSFIRIELDDESPVNKQPKR